VDGLRRASSFTFPNRAGLQASVESTSGTLQGRGTAPVGQGRGTAPVGLLPPKDAPFTNHRRSKVASYHATALGSYLLWVWSRPASPMVSAVGQVVGVYLVACSRKCPADDDFLRRAFARRDLRELVDKACAHP
jgi:hypothetical protein